MNKQDQANYNPNANPHISPVARVSILAGILSVISAFLALWGAFWVMRAGIYTFLPIDREYLYPLFWLLWLLLPILTIICGSHARKTATEHGRHHLAVISLVLGYLSLAIIAAVIFAEITLFFHSLGCTPSSPCS